MPFDMDRADQRIVRFGFCASDLRSADLGIHGKVASEIDAEGFFAVADRQNTRGLSDEWTAVDIPVAELNLFPVYFYLCGSGSVVVAAGAGDESRLHLSDAGDVYADKSVFYIIRGIEANRTELRC